jgi:predicted SPOUT superfamily RNA methylase MTH1
LFVDEEGLRGKTIKAGQIARAVSIFGVSRIYIYRDGTKNYDRDFETAKQIFEYLETPQYLRKRLISRKPDLEFAGILPPLRIPHHLKEPKVMVGETREAYLVIQNGELRADVGSKELANYEGKGQAGQRVTVKITCEKPLKATQARPPENSYWGYEVRRAPSLARFLRSASFDVIILTSRLGESIVQQWHQFCEKVKPADTIILCFGSPDLGVDRMLKQDNTTISDFPNTLCLNFFPSQNVATVRLEEAILGCLSIINVACRV